MKAQGPEFESPETSDKWVLVPMCNFCAHKVRWDPQNKLASQIKPRHQAVN